MTPVSDPIELEVPLSTSSASTVRAVAAAICADLGFSIDDIEDLRLAINESVSLLADVDGDGTQRLRVGFAAGDGVVTVRCGRHGGAASDGHGSDIDPLARRILDTVVDEYHLGDGEVTLVKRVATTE